MPANYNLITLEGDVSGRQSFFGQGAGRYPTAYNVVQDCVDFSPGKGFYTTPGRKVTVDNSVKLRYYVRTDREDPWLKENTEKHWAGAVVTRPVEVSVMHQWLKAHPDAFMAAFA